jgi:two-component system, OmpR family, sensor histidine kinase KdpD
MAQQAETHPQSSSIGPPAPTRRGTLRVYLGAAPGSGKTFAMLREGQARRSQGEDVVVGYIETYGRPRTVEAIGRLDLIPRLKVPYRGTTLEEMDLDAVLARRPQVALVDELAHTNAPGVRHAKRWQDVEQLRDAGIDVVTTVNVQHVESVKDLVESITGIPVRETVPDRVLDGADEIQFIDIAPEALRKRMRHGNIYAPDKVDTALRNFFRPGNLGALREMALRLVADRVGTARGAVRPAPEDVLVAVSGAGSSEALIRRGARLARRTDGLCTVLGVRGARRAAPDEAVGRLAAIAEQVGATFVERAGSDPVRVIVDLAHRLGTHHVVIGESAPPSLLGGWRATLADRVIEALPRVDVHVLARFAAEASRPHNGDDARPAPDDLLRRLGTPPGRRGTLRVYLGYARGCGTTSAMLDEARRRASRGTDVVVATVRTYGRGPCEAAIGDLEVLGGRSGTATTGRFDLDALLARNPQVTCLDDLARVDAGGRRLVEVLQTILDAGITVIATLHLTDLASTVASMGPLLGYDATHPRIDDAVLDMADEIELVDVTPAVLTDRLRQGAIDPPARVAHALQTEFRPQVLDALREMAFRVIAQHTDRRLVAYMRERGIEQPWEARARVLACVPPRPRMEPLIQAAAALAARIDGEFRAATVRTRSRSDDEKQLLGQYAALTHQLGGEFVTLRRPSVAGALADYAREALVTEMVVSRGRPKRRPWRRSALRSLIRMVKDVDVHVLATEAHAKAGA